MLDIYKEKDAKEVIGLWNEAATKIGYKELNELSFSRIFSLNPYFKPSQAFVLREAGELIGFACGCMGEDLPLGQTSGYITCVIIKETYENTENYQLLLGAVEETFLKAEKIQAEILFFNPMTLPWYIKNTPQHEHNNAPGVFKDSRLYRELLGFGYAERAIENAMYLELKEFQIPKVIREKEDKLELTHYEVALYEESRHGKVAEMLSQLGNPLWEKEILEAIREKLPVVIAAKEGEAVGFAGPIKRQESGRGYFTGIGVIKEQEGHGLGTLLFYKLCEEEKKAGANYMSLYTGSENPAGKIYEQAGFVTVQQFAVMRKRLV